MDLLVLLEVRARAEPLIAELACEGLLTCVDALVADKVGDLQEERWSTGVFLDCQHEVTANLGS